MLKVGNSDIKVIDFKKIGTLATGVGDIFKNPMIRIENLLKILHSGLRRRFGQEA